MKGLRDALHRQAGNIAPTPDFADVHRRIDRRRHRRGVLRVSLLTFGSIASIAGAIAYRQHQTVDRVRLRSASVEAVAEVQEEALGGLVIADRANDRSYRQFTLNRSEDPTSRGPYSVVVRRANGNLGSGSAVVTFPVPVELQQPAEVGQSIPPVIFSIVVERTGGSVSVRSANLDGPQLRAIAARVSICLPR
jgi:hypothetical protein